MTVQVFWLRHQCEVFRFTAIIWMLPLTAPFLLTNLLLDDLKKAAETGDARVVVVTSALHDARCCKRTRSKTSLTQQSNSIFVTVSVSALYLNILLYRKSKMQKNWLFFIIIRCLRKMALNCFVLLESFTCILLIILTLTRSCWSSIVIATDMSDSWPLCEIAWQVRMHYGIRLGLRK